MLQVDWLTGDAHVGRRFLEVLVSSEDCLRLFESDTVKFFTDYLWNESFSYFVKWYFLPFMVLGFLPLLLMAFLMPIVDHANEGVFYYMAYLTCLVLFNLGTVGHIWLEFKEMRKLTLRKYLKGWSNYYQWTMICVNSTLTYKIWSNYFGGEDARLEPQRVHLMYALILNLVELFNRIRIFKFFAYFVRQMEEIVVDALPLGAMLGFIVVAQALLFWVLDLNSYERVYVGSHGFLQILVDSYRLALGDFEIREEFVDNTENILVFWAVFCMGSLISLLVILNMVIAVMGATFNRVAEQTESHVMRSKLDLICCNYYRFPPSLKRKFKNQRYLLAVEVDPEIDPIEKESMETRLCDRISRLENVMELQVSNINNIKLNLITFYDKLSQLKIGV